MALQKEIWLGSIVENLFADNSFLSKAFNADDFVENGKILHIPNAGSNPTVSMGPIGRPKIAKELADSDISVSVKEFYVDPIYIQNAEKYELSYNKRESVVSRSRSALRDKVAEYILSQWIPTDPERTLTTESTVLTYDDILGAATKLNAEDVPQEGRYLLLPAVLYQQLIRSLNKAEANAFLATADAKKGIIGQLYGFNVMMRSKAGGTKEAPIALAWHQDYVCRAQGEHEVFTQENDPLYYGDVLSFMVRATGAKMHEDGIGTLALKLQGA